MCTSDERPSAASVANHTTITGPNRPPIRSVPYRWMAKTMIRMMIGNGHDVVVEDGRGDRQSLDRAEHRNRRRDHAVAVEQRRAGDPEQDQRRRRRVVLWPVINAVSARIPPSPWLSARMTRRCT